MKTLTGKTMDDVRALLDAPLPPQAYKAVPGAGGFTDIDANWQNRVFNSVFGLCGFGWGFEFQASDLEVRMDQKENGKLAADAVLKHLVLWFKLIDGTGTISRHEIPAASANRNEFGNMGYAMKGAITSALGAAASKLGWQESVYMGVRDHNNTNASVPRPPAGTTPDPAATLPPPTTTVTPPADPGPAYPLQFWRCFSGHVMTVSEAPKKCAICGATTGLTRYDTFSDAQRGPARDTPFSQPPASQPADAKPPVTPAFNTIACFSCGEVAATGATVCASCGLPVMRPDDTKALHAEMGRLSGGQRSVWLRCASTVTGRTIKGYSEVSCHEYVQCIRFFRANPFTPGQPWNPAGKPSAAGKDAPPPTAPVGAGGSGAQGAQGGNPPPPPQTPPPAQGAYQPPQSRNMNKLQLVERIFALCQHIGLAGAADITRELGQRFGRPVTSSAQCTIEELNKFLDEVEFACHQKGVAI